MEGRKGQHSIISDSERGTGAAARSAKGHPSVHESIAVHEESKQIQLIKSHPDTSQSDVTCDKCGGRGCQCDLVAAANRVGRTDQCVYQTIYIDYSIISDAEWGMLHSFFAVMSVLQFYNKHWAMYLISHENIIELVKHGHLVPPTADEISDKSKGDALFKGVVIVQVWGL